MAGPGIRTQTGARAGAGAPLRTAGATTFLVGLTDKGRADAPVAVTSMSEFEREFGPRVSYGFITDDVAAAFEHGAPTVWVRRVVGPAATKGTLTLSDRAAVPVATVRLDALGPGASSADIRAEVVAGGIAGTATLNITYRVGQLGAQRETFPSFATVAALVATVNARSVLVRATNLGSASVPAADQLPALLVPTVLSTGTDDRAAILTSHLTAAMNDSFDAEKGPGAVAIPGYPAGAVAAAIAAHCSTNLRVGLVHGEVDDTKEEAAALAQAVTAAPNGHYLLLLWPWLKVADPDIAGTTVLVPPTGAAAGVRAAAHQNKGPWQVPGADDGRLAPTVVGLATVLGNDTDYTALNEAGVSAIRKIGASFEVYGWRALSTNTENFYHLTSQDVLNSLAWAVKIGARRAGLVFDPLDSRGQFRTRSETVAKGEAEGYRALGGLSEKRNDDGDLVDPGYAVTVNEFPAERRAEIILAARPPEAAELIDVTVIRVAATAAV